MLMIMSVTMVATLLKLDIYHIIFSSSKNHNSFIGIFINLIVTISTLETLFILKHKEDTAPCTCISLELYEQQKNYHDDNPCVTSVILV